jgi:hypothetical protein
LDKSKSFKITSSSLDGMLVSKERLPGNVIVPSLIVLIVAEPKSIWDKVILGIAKDNVPKAEFFKNLRLFIVI